MMLPCLVMLTWILRLTAWWFSGRPLNARDSASLAVVISRRVTYNIPYSIEGRASVTVIVIQCTREAHRHKVMR